MTMNRRALLLSGASLIPLTACGGVGTQIPTWVNAIEAIVPALDVVLPELAAVGLPAATAATVQKAIDAIKQAIAAIGAGSSVAQGQSVLLQVEAYINALASFVAPYIKFVPGGSAISLIIAALPAIEAMLNIAATALTSATQRLAASAPVPTGRRIAGRMISPPSSGSSELALAELMRRAGR